MVKLKCSLKGEREKNGQPKTIQKTFLSKALPIYLPNIVLALIPWGTSFFYLCSGYTKKTLETSHRGPGFSGNHAPDSFSSRTGASASQSFKVKAHSNQQRWPPRGRPRLPAPASMERSGSHLLQQTSLRFQLRAAKCQSSQSGPPRALLERPRDHSENNPCGCLG